MLFFAKSLKPCGFQTKSGGSEGDVKNATPLQRANWFDRFVAVKEVFEVSKSSLFNDYKDERIFTGGFKI